MNRRFSIFDKPVLAASSGSSAPSKLTSPSRASAQFLLAVSLLLALHVVTWTVYGTVALGMTPIHDDMVEAWVWGQEWQLGYFKHPPLFGWVAGAWFSVFPRSDFSFYLLAACNSAVGVAGVIAVARYFGSQRDALAAAAIVLLTPLYGFLSLKFNANAILVPLWPWATFAFLRALDTGSIRHGLILGGLGALTMLGKYYSAFLLLTFFIVSLLPEFRMRFYRSPAPYVALATFLALLAPHIIWSYTNGFPPVAYAASKFKYSLAQMLGWASVTALGPLIFFSAVAAILAVIVRRTPRWALIDLLMRDGKGRALLALSTVPFLLTVLFGVLGHAKVSLSYTIPIFFSVPVLIVMLVPAAAFASARKKLVLCAIVFQCGVMGVSPVVALGRVYFSAEGTRMPNKELAREATTLWHRTVGLPLRIMAGYSGHVSAISFYSPDSPSQLINFSFRSAPWITQERINHEGVLIVCDSSDQHCLGSAERLSVGPIISVKRDLQTTHFGWPGDIRSYTFIVVPPLDGSAD